MANLAIELLLVLNIVGISDANWNEWWTYDGISGPSYWGVINPDWNMCSKGKQQSPVNIDPAQLIYDEKLTKQEFLVDKQQISGSLHNTGQTLVFKIDADRAAKMPVNITGGPLSYRYQFEQMFLHWGSRNENDENGASGSEHAINGHFFPAEIQLYGFNADLFHNLSQGMMQPNGAVGVVIMIQESDRGTNRGIKTILSHLKKVHYKGQSSPVHGLNIKEIMPSTSYYMTYEGSTTFPGCWETVTWIILNKPIYLSRQEMFELRKLKQGDKVNPKAPLSNNRRPLQMLNSRTIRTNVAFSNSKGYTRNDNSKSQGYGIYGQGSNDKECPNFFERASYQANAYLESSVGK